MGIVKEEREKRFGYGVVDDPKSNNEWVGRWVGSGS